VARRQPPSADRPTLEYLEHLGPHRVAVGDLTAAGLRGVVYGPVSGRKLPAVALGRGWLQPVRRYTRTMRYLASWGIVVVAPHTERVPLPSHAGLARDLSLALRLVTGGKLAGGVISVDGRRVGVLGHSIGGGAAVLAASSDPAIKAVFTVTAAETKPSAITAAGTVMVPGLHLVGDRDPLAAEEGKQIAKSWGGPVQLRRIRKAEHLGLAEGRHWTSALTGDGHEKQIQQATRVLASAFFLRHLADQDQLADALEAKVAGTMPEPLIDGAGAPAG